MNLDRPRSSARILGAATLVALLALATAACVKDDPIVTGNRDAAAPAVAKKAIVPLPDPSDVDPPDCSHCSSALDTNARRGGLCRKNTARSSAVLLNELVGCVCEDKCINECANYCAGATQERACLPCILSGCADLLAECSSDVAAK